MVKYNPFYNKAAASKRDSRFYFDCWPIKFFYENLILPRQTSALEPCVHPAQSRGSMHLEQGQGQT